MLVGLAAFVTTLVHGCAASFAAHTQLTHRPLVPFLRARTEPDRIAPLCTQAMPRSVKVGQTILAADGTLVLTVKEILADGVLTTVMNDCTIGEKKNMNLPGVVVELPTVTEKDKDDLINFGLKCVVAV